MVVTNCSETISCSQADNQLKQKTRESKTPSAPASRAAAKQGTGATCLKSSGISQFVLQAKMKRIRKDLASNQVNPTSPFIISILNICKGNGLPKVAPRIN
jgi:hypothetical protein